MTHAKRLTLLLGSAALLVTTSAYAASGGNVTPKPTQLERVQQGQPVWWPGDTPGPRSGMSGVSTLQNAFPTADLLITVRVLHDLIKSGRISLAPDQRASLRPLLGSLPGRTQFDPSEAHQLQRQVLATLWPSDAALLRAERRKLEQAAQNLLSRVRMAAVDGPVNPVLVRYGFMVPGGPALVQQLAAQPRLNPYAQPGVNATLLSELLATL